MAKVITIASQKKENLLLTEGGDLKLFLQKKASLDLTLFFEKPYRGKIEIVVEEGANLKICDFFLNLREESKKIVLQKGSQLHYFGAVVLDENKSVSNILIEHVGEASISRFIFKGVLKQKASLFLNTQVNIFGTLSDCQQAAKFLVLNRGSKAVVEPNLSVFTSNVKASHGAAISNILQEELFYLRARGISCFEARRLLMLGFIQEILDKEERRELQEKVRNYLWK